MRKSNQGNEAQDECLLLLLIVSCFLPRPSSPKVHHRRVKQAGYTFVIVNRDTHTALIAKGCVFLHDPHYQFFQIVSADIEDFGGCVRLVNSVLLPGKTTLPQSLLRG